MPALSMRAVTIAVALAGCVGDGANSQPGVDANPGGGDGNGGTPDGSGGGLEPGSLTVSWLHGSANCNANAEPDVQLHEYNASTFIVRQNKCRTFEAPFVYVLVGTQRALVLDSGDLTSTALRDAIVARTGSKPLVVAHSHAHGDHTRGDATFSGLANVTIVGKSVGAVQAAFGIATWPTSPGTIDLGDRVLDVIGIPGHETTHIAVYDRKTGLLLSGDSLYPGMLFINDWTTYRASMHRLAQFVAAHPIAHVLGAHVEMTATPQQAYPYGTTYQPNEHVLQLTAAHAAELDAALVQLGPNPPNNPVVHDDFIIDPQ